MMQLYQATSQAARLNSSRGFTLIELLIVIAIIAILASLAIPQYMKYQRKSKVASYAQPIARGCLMDMVAFCAENPSAPSSRVYIDQAIGNGQLANCPQNNTTNVTTAGGSVTVSVSFPTGSNTNECRYDGEVWFNTKVVAKLAGVNDYQAVCSYLSGKSIKCTVEAQ